MRCCTSIDWIVFGFQQHCILKRNNVYSFGNHVRVNFNKTRGDEPLPPWRAHSSQVGRYTGDKILHQPFTSISMYKLKVANWMERQTLYDLHYCPIETLAKECNVTTVQLADVASVAAVVWRNSKINQTKRSFPRRGVSTSHQPLPPSWSQGPGSGVRLLTAEQRYSSALFQPWRHYSLCSARHHPYSQLCKHINKEPSQAQTNSISTLSCSY